MIKLRSILVLISLIVFSAFSSMAAEMEEDFNDVVNNFEILNSVEPGMTRDFVIMQPEDFIWDESRQELQQKVIYGDPSKEGFYVLRARFPAGVTSIPHFHSEDRAVTVIEGTWYAGSDASHDLDKTTAIPAGGFMIHPAGAVHYDGAKDEAVIVEIRGMGPVITEAVPITQ